MDDSRSTGPDVFLAHQLLGYDSNWAFGSEGHFILQTENSWWAQEFRHNTYDPTFYIANDLAHFYINTSLLDDDKHVDKLVEGGMTSYKSCSDHQEHVRIEVSLSDPDLVNKVKGLIKLIECVWKTV